MYMLRNLQIKATFLTATNSGLVEEFYKPALNESTLYQRGTAFFSIEFLLGLMDNIVEFVYRGGVVHLITSVELDEDTLKSFTSGYLLKSDDVVAELHKKLEEYLAQSRERGADEEARLDVVANMIAARHMVIKVAHTEHGIYHEKIGVFSDAEGNSVAFYGSANETVSGFYNNYETLTIGASWGDTASLVDQYKNHFVRLWTNGEEGVRVVDFPTALESKIIGAFKKSPTLDVAIQKLMKLRHALDATGADRRKLYDYQNEAVAEFVANGYCHLFEMATGTGKTFTAVKAIERMALDKKYLNVIVLAPLVDLQRQWEKEIDDGLDVPHRVFKFGGCGRDDALRFRLSTSSASSGHQVFASVAICVYDTYFSSAYAQLRPLKGQTLVVVDETHNLTSGNVDVVAGVSKYRLGLSATPQRYSKKETEKLFQLFVPEGGSAYTYSLEKAIANGYLSRYEYYPLEVELTADESDKYAAESARIAKLVNIYKNEPNAFNRKRMEDALMARSRIVKKASNKISLLGSMVSSNKYDFHNSVVFCGPGRLVVDGVTTDDRIVDLVTRTIGHNESHHYFPAKFTSGEDDRPARLEGFRQGLTDTLVAVKCFDEGLDVPALDKIYIMASDSSLRQTIQRRGRVLRISKDTGKTLAYIYDMVAGERIGDRFFPLKAELPRVYECSRLSENPQSSSAILAGYVPGSDGETFDELENND